jgi:Domain of unknown function (DUF4129)
MDAATARREAAHILAERRFHRHEVPRPFRGLLDALSRILDPIVRALGNLFGQPLIGWPLTALIVLVALLFVARTVRRRTWEGLHGLAERGPRPLDPTRLEREADEAERRGDLERAIRLRFRAGLLRLDRAKAIELEASTTSGEVSRRLRSRDFDDVAGSFDAVVYGRRPPRGEDVELSRAGWTRVLAGVGAR